MQFEKVTPRARRASMFGVGHTSAFAASSHLAESWSIMKKTMSGLLMLCLTRHSTGS
jgi:hypothetical protein